MDNRGHLDKDKIKKEKVNGNGSHIFYKSWLGQSLHNVQAQSNPERSHFYHKNSRARQRCVERFLHQSLNQGAWSLSRFYFYP